jgi:hypothetical protein
VDDELWIINYGGYYGNYVACHLAGAIQHFSSVEWDEATTAEIDASGYMISEWMGLGTEYAWVWSRIGRDNVRAGD